MLKKIIWIILIILLTYIIIVFVSPDTADKIGKKIGILHFNEIIRHSKTKADEIYTNLPNQEEWEKAYDKTLSGAVDLKNDSLSGAYELKNKIDDIRGNLNQTAEQYEDLKNQVTKTKDQIEEGIETVKDISNALSGTIQDTGSGKIGK